MRWGLRRGRGGKERVDCASSGAYTIFVEAWTVGYPFVPSVLERGDLLLFVGDGTDTFRSHHLFTSERGQCAPCCRRPLRGANIWQDNGAPSFQLLLKG